MEPRDHVTTEKENAKTFQIADFDAQKLSGQQIAAGPPSDISLFATSPGSMSSGSSASPSTSTRVSGNFPSYPETFQGVQKIF